jgi:alkylation response protein AidB-like acyl-CoA dehydrogenase
MTVHSPAQSGVISRRDLQFLLHEWLAVERLVQRPRFEGQSRDLFDEVLELSERIATDRFAPHNALGDSNEPYIGDDGTIVLIPEVAAAIETFGTAGLVGCSIDLKVGGMQLPFVVGYASFSFFLGANVGTSGYLGLTIAAANLLLANGSAEQLETWVRPMVDGRFLGTMCLSEPQAGSSLADISTRAEPQPDGTYRLFGTKMWISGGDHEMGDNIVHMVLAKIPGAPPGVKGISLFIVPRVLVGPNGTLEERNDVALAGVNHKMGYRGTVNTILGFGEGAQRPGGSAGAVGYLVGDQHSGLGYMFHMMNESRIAVGLAAASIGYAGYSRALHYARERTQGRPPDRKDPASPQVPIIQHVDVRRMLLAQKAYVEGGLALCLYCCYLVDEAATAPDNVERERAATLLDVLTPIAKAWPSQWCLAANDLAIQIFGGYGYARESLVEQLYRDNRLNAIHEGTNGIQALDLLGRKVAMQDGSAFQTLLEAIQRTLERAQAGGGERAELASVLGAVVERLADVTHHLLMEPDSQVRLANATAFLEATGHIVVAWLWLDQLEAAEHGTGDFYEGKRQAARFFYAYELPRVEPQLNLLAGLDRTVLEMRNEWF